MINYIFLEINFLKFNNGRIKLYNEIYYFNI